MTKEELKPYGDSYGEKFRQYENRIEELKEELTKKADTNHSLVEQMARLEEENAELKEKLEIEKNARGDWFGKAVTKDRQLTEAKKIIKDMLRDIPNRMWYTDDVIKRAEDFIKE